MFAKGFRDRERSLEPRTVTGLTTPVGGQKASRVGGIPDAARGPADASRWIDASGEHVYHIAGADAGDAEAGEAERRDFAPL